MRNKPVRDDSLKYAPYKRVEWIDRFAREYAQKLAAQPKDKSSSVYDQVQSMFGNRNKHHTVDSLVKEMQEKIGLKDYLSALSSEEQKDGKKVTQAQLQEANKQVTIFPNVDNTIRDQIIQYIKNKIKTHRGAIAIPALQEAIVHVFRSDGIQSKDVNDEAVAKFINQMIIEEKQRNPIKDFTDPNLGKGIGTTDSIDVDPAMPFMKK